MKLSFIINTREIVYYLAISQKVSHLSSTQVVYACYVAILLFFVVELFLILLLALLTLSS